MTNSTHNFKNTFTYYRGIKIELSERSAMAIRNGNVFCCTWSDDTSKDGNQLEKIKTKLDKQMPDKIKFL